MTRPNSAKRWARRIADAYGSPDPTGRIVVNASQTDLARRTGVSTGTVGYYLDRLGDAVVSRCPIVFDAAHLGLDEPPAAPGTAKGIDAVLEAVAAVLAAQAQLTAALAALTGGPAARPREDRADVREIARGSANNSRALLESQKTESQVEEPLSHSLARECRDRVRESRESIADRRDGELDELIAPLVILCARQRLVGITNRSRLRSALEPYDGDQIRAAVERLVNQINAGAPIRSPIGLLVRLAEQGDRWYFESPTPAPVADNTEAPTESVSNDWPIELIEEFEAMVLDDLARLPDLVRTGLTTNPESMRRLRSDKYRAMREKT